MTPGRLKLVAGTFVGVAALGSACIRGRSVSELAQAKGAEGRPLPAPLGLLDSVKEPWQAAGSVPASIRFNNRMSNVFRLTGIVVALDGKLLYRQEDASDTLAKQVEVLLYAGLLPVGNHLVVVGVGYRGNGRYRGYHFELRTSHSFAVVDGSALSLTLDGFEMGGDQTPIEQRPRVGWQENVHPMTDGGPIGLNR